MGGAKKLSLAQMQKRQAMRAKKREGRAKTAPKTKAPEKKIGGIDVPDFTSKKFVDELVSMRAVTPYAVASKYNLRLSIAKDILEKLEQLGTIQYVAGNSRLRIYRVAAS